MEGSIELDLGKFFRDFEFKAMINGGYIILGTLYDIGFSYHSKMIRDGYLKESRVRPIFVDFQIKGESLNTDEQVKTRVQTAIITSLEMFNLGSDGTFVRFVAVDPASYYLNVGDAAGSVYKGRIDEVVQQVVAKYAPRISLEISNTTDSSMNKWWMMRQDPMSFITSLMDWSPAVTQKKTHWIIASDNEKLLIKEQAMWQSQERAYYNYATNDEQGVPEMTKIQDWNLIADNSLSVTQTKLITSGVSAISGSYEDRITDLNENRVFVQDQNTENKKTVLTDGERSYSKPADQQGGAHGWTHINSVPEIYSAGEIGLNYDQYIDGRARNLYLNMLNNLIRAKFTVLGHGIWSNSVGLGVDTVYIRWSQANSLDDYAQHWWMSGYWLVYGFHHRVSKTYWYTDLYCARHDYDATSIKVPVRE